MTSCRRSRPDTSGEPTPLGRLKGYVVVKDLIVSLRLVDVVVLPVVVVSVVDKTKKECQAAHHDIVVAYHLTLRIFTFVVFVVLKTLL